MRGVIVRVLTFVAVSILPLLTFAQAPTNMRDRDPDLTLSKKLYEDLQ